ncbi:TatD family hydrolase [Butyricicoccus porcorum]|uniref:Hydrolase TatD n=1 Tax=Butyricicoccus porcorum TaxID=1945634 RepID=A0A252F1G7_9FIRM|nr:TatD family hydrolase [Butyricicoccus porcorum]MCI6926756.1 TatD family hydrolase [Butyricicoccus porcorum]OUM19521.1 hydrolase TatD [Butyricicoccus porcorum]
MLFDTHAHYDDDWFDTDREALLASMPAHNVGLIVNPGCTVETSETAIRLAETHDFMYAAVGIHPEYSMGVTQADIDRIRELSAHPKVKAIGEIGLDYYWEKRSPETTPPREKQKQLLRAQLELAREVGLPVIIHDRDAHEDCLNIVKEYDDLRGVYHCYSGSLETAQEILKLGWYLSFTGVITYGKAKKARHIIEHLPMDRIMIETDSPYLTPEPERLQAKRVRNSSLFVHRVAERIAEFQGLTVEEVERITTENGKRFFAID